MDPKKKLINSLIGFANKISVNYPIKRMILFGSRAWGNPQKYSDVDLIIVSPRFRKKARLDRSPPLYMEWDIDYPVDFICLTPKEFERKKKQVSIVREAVRSGIEVI